MICFLLTTFCKKEEEIVGRNETLSIQTSSSITLNVDTGEQKNQKPLKEGKKHCTEKDILTRKKQKK